MKDLELLIALLAAVAALVWLARAASVPYPVVLLLGGLGIGAIPGLPRLEVDPEVVFLVFVPPLVHAAGYVASPRHLVRAARPIAPSAVLLVGLTIGTVALVAHALVNGLSWAAAFVLATVVAPTDLVAATAVFRRLGAPERIVTLVEGENLVNDGTAITAWRLAVAAAVAGSLSLGDVVVELLAVAGGGTLIGLAGGWLLAWLRRRLDDSLIEITVTLLTPYVLYVAAEEAGASGILAAVVSGLYLGFRDHELTSPATRLQAFGFWAVLTFVLESLLFILVGLQLPAVIERLEGQSIVALTLAGAAISLTIVVVRIAFQLLALDLPVRERLVVGWAGMRGAISLAIALAVPLSTETGGAFPARDTIVFLTICVIALTLVVQGLTLPVLIRRLPVDQEQDTFDTRRQALVRFRTVEAALDTIGRRSLSEDASVGLVERARALYSQRANQLAGECSSGVPETGTDTEAWLRLRLELIDVERRQLVELRNEGTITNQVMNAVQGDLDLEAAHLDRRLDGSRT